MEPVTAQLRRLRMAAQPRLSVRAMADALGIPLSSYARYESDRGFKRPFLPIDFVRRIAPILAERGVEPSEIMALAGVVGHEAAADVKAVSDRASQVRFVQMTVAMPSEAAMTDMFETLLRAFGDGLPRAELARGLARRLPVALAQLQAPLVETNPETETLPEAAAPDPATDRLAPQSQPRK